MRAWRRSGGSRPRHFFIRPPARSGPLLVPSIVTRRTDRARRLHARLRAQLGTGGLDARQCDLSARPLPRDRTRGWGRHVTAAEGQRRRARAPAVMLGCSSFRPACVRPSTCLPFGPAICAASATSSSESTSHHGLFEHRFHPLTRRTAFSNRMITAPPGATCSRTQVCARRAVGLDVSPTLVCDWNCVGGALVGQAIADLVVRLDDAHIVLALASTFLPADAGGERCRRSSRAPA
jgi:hypothetical protein